MAHPANAAYVSGDGKVSFDQWGRKLDSLGNVAWGDRQSVSGAGGRPIERPQQQQQQPAQQQGYNPLSGGSANTGVPARTGSAMAPSPAQARPTTLLPGGIDPATGQKVATYYNGGLSFPGDDYFMRNPQAQPQPQAWRPPPPNSTAYPQAAVAPRPTQPAPMQMQPWRPLPGDMVLPTQQYTYQNPFAYQNPGLPFASGPNPNAFDPMPATNQQMQMRPPSINANGTLSFGMFQPGR